MIFQYSTKYAGIYVQENDGHFFVIDDNGCDEYMGRAYPAQAAIDAYRNEIIRNS